MPIPKLHSLYGPTLLEVPFAGAIRVVVQPINPSTIGSSELEYIGKAQSFETESLAEGSPVDVQRYVQALLPPNQQSVSYSIAVEHDVYQNNKLAYTEVHQAGVYTAVRSATQLAESSYLANRVGLATDFKKLAAYEGYPATISILSDSGVSYKSSKLPIGVHHYPYSCADQAGGVHVTLSPPSYRCEYVEPVCQKEESIFYNVTVNVQEEYKYMCGADQSALVKKGEKTYINYIINDAETAFDAWYYNGVRREDIPGEGFFTPTEDCTLTAHFMARPDNLVDIIAVPNNELYGTTSGGGNSKKYFRGDTVTLTATSADSEAYRFEGWRSMHSSESALSASSPYSFVLNTMERALIIIAEFIPINQRIVVSVVSENENYGTVKCSPTPYENRNWVAAVKGDCAIHVTATPLAGYQFDAWYCNGLRREDIPQKGCIRLEENCTLEAHFIPQ